MELKNDIDLDNQINLFTYLFICQHFLSDDFELKCLENIPSFQTASSVEGTVQSKMFIDGMNEWLKN